MSDPSAVAVALLDRIRSVDCRGKFVCSDREMALAIDALTAERCKPLIAELRRQALSFRERMTSGFGCVPCGYVCKICFTEWGGEGERAAETHAANCILSGGGDAS